MQMELSAENGRLPTGVRFHPTEVELVMHYLKRKALGQPLEAGFVAEVDIYQFHPADLRAFACFNKELNWYFFCAIGKKYGSGDRKSRSTHSGFWKPTGNPRPVLYRKRTVGNVKTLVFHEGKAAKGKRTDWFMYEYELEESELANGGVSDATVLCKIFKRGSLGPRNGEQYGAPYDEEEWNTEEENNVLVPVADQDQSASAVMNDLVSANANSLHTPEQVYSGVVSVSGVYHASTPISEGANNAALVVDQAVNGMPAADIVSSSQAPVLNYTDDGVFADDFIGTYNDYFNNDYPGGMTLDDLDSFVS